MEPLKGDARYSCAARHTRRGFLFFAAGAVSAFSQVNTKQGTIRFFGEVNSQSMNELISACERFTSEGITDVLMNISSNGGQVDPALSAYEYLASVVRHK